MGGANRVLHLRRTMAEPFSAAPAGHAVQGPVAVVSTFPPAVCGIGLYAEQQVRRLEDDGVAASRLDLARLQAEGWRGAPLREFLAAARAAPRLVLHYQMWMFRDDAARGKVGRHLKPLMVLLWFLLRNGRRTEMVVHEYGWRLWKGRLDWVQYPYSALLFLLPRRLLFHTPRERAAFRRLYPLRRRGFELRPHEADFRPKASADRAAARSRLGLPAEARIVLCIGFYKVAKGFRDAAALARGLHAQGLLHPSFRLDVVTSVQDGRDAAAVADLATLRAEAKAPVHLHEGFVDDETFDLWLAASDAVLLPYRSSFSSGVAARARVMGRPLWVSDVGGLPDQAGPKGRVFRSWDELAALLRAA
jgi:glycosyltransferase involved in cell wall biosynthesis